MNRDEFQHALWDVNDHYEQGKTSQKAEANILACYDEQRAEIERLQDESEQLRMAVGLAATIKSDMEMRCDDPVGMMQEVHAYTAQLQAQLAGWKELEGKDIYQQYTNYRAKVKALQAQLATAKGIFRDIIESYEVADHLGDVDIDEARTFLCTEPKEPA